MDCRCSLYTPHQRIVAAAQEIAQGKRETRLKPGPNDEIGVLSHSLNTMLNSLRERRLQIEEHARTLEIRVQEGPRTWCRRKKNTEPWWTTCPLGSIGF